MSFDVGPRCEITSLADQQRLLAERAAVLCLWFPWSGPAVMARRTLTHWHEHWHLYHKTPIVPLYFLDGDLVPELTDWVANTLRETGGYGSVHLLKRGKVLLSVPSVLDFGLNSLSRECEVCLGAS